MGISFRFHLHLLSFSFISFPLLCVLNAAFIAVSSAFIGINAEGMRSLLFIN